MKKLSFLILITGLAFSSKAQISFGPSIAGTQNDINYLGSAYLAPFSEAMAFSLTQGWYNTAKVKRTGRFEIGFTPSVTIVPNEFRTFTIDPSKLEELELVNPNDNVAPTVFGEDAPGPELQYTDPTLRAFSGGRFNMPAGLGYAIAPNMTIHAGVGLPLDFELSGHYLPSTGIPYLEGSEIGLWGLGLKHNLKQYIPGGSAIPFSIAAFASYSQFNLGQDLEPDANNDKRIDLNADAFMTRLLISKKLLFLTFYGGVGYNYLNSSFKVAGTYEYLNPLQPLNPEQSISDPIDLSSTNGSGWAGNLGLRVKFLVFGYVSADYTFGTFSAVNLNLGFSWDI
ncbi:MAG: hypothetical protein NXI09_07960 [Bacteroidetes bacterium]|nr:hypothetical protein [Bacteroidota bacterium]